VEQRAIGQYVCAEGQTGIVLTIAGWMFDAVACSKMTVGTPRVDLAALLELRQVLIGAGMPRESPSDNGFVRE
jgi:hypothetical protein